METDAPYVGNALGIECPGLDLAILETASPINTTSKLKYTLKVCLPNIHAM